jgi:hypothetical protein
MISLVFDTTVIGVTLYQTLEFLRLQKKLKAMPKKTMSSILPQGE